MKKFLTVLLALSVVFTYTFGTAFAAPADEPTGDKIITEAKVFDNIDRAYKQALADAKAEKDAALATTFKSGATDIVATSTTGILVTKTAVEKVYNDLYDLAVKTIEANRATALAQVTTAIKAVTPKAYNGNFRTDTGGVADGYAVYVSAWGEVATYFTTDMDVDGVTAQVQKAGKAEYIAIFTAPAGAVAGSADGIKAVSKAVFAETKAATLAAVQAIDLSVYSKEYKGGAASNYDLALADITTAIAWINAQTVGADWAANQALLDKMTQGPAGTALPGTYLYKAGINQAGPTGALFAGGTFDTSKTFTGLDKIAKNADLPTEAAKLAWAQEKVLTSMINSVNSALAESKIFYNDKIVGETLKGAKADALVIANAKEKIAQAEELAAGAIETITYLVKSTDTIAKLVTVDTANFTNSKVDVANWAYTATAGVDALEKSLTDDTFKAWAPDKATAADVATYKMYAASGADAVNVIMANVKDLKAQAELAKKTIGIDGTTLVEIENALAAGVKKVYNQTAVATLNVGDAVKALYNRQAALIDNGTTAVVVSDRSYNSLAKWVTDLDTSYDSQYKDAVRKVLNDTETNIKAATTVALAETAFVDGYKALEAIPTKTTKNAFQATKAYLDLKAQYDSEITAYITYKTGVITSADYSWNPTTTTTKLKDTFADAYTLDELKAAYTAARATVDNLKTKAQMRTAYDALMVKVNALAKNPTLADKVAILAVAKEVVDHNDYCDLIGDVTNKVIVTTVKNAADMVQALEVKGLKAQADAINKDYKVTVDEAKAVEALRTAYDAIVASYTLPNMSAANLGAVKTYFNVGVDIEGIEAKLVAAQVIAVKEMIAMLPADGSNVKGIKAARAAYEALGRDAKYGTNGVYQSSSYDKLVDLEKLIKKDIKGGVLGTTLTATSKATKGAIKISWKKSAGYKVDGYQVYKSTKKFSGFKKAFTTKATSYKNTKGLKAGKTYYYKVRGFRTVDGVKVYTHWSTKVSRVAK